MRDQVPDRRAFRPRGLVPLDGAFLDRDQRRVGREQLGHGRELELPRLRPNLAEHLTGRRDDRHRRVVDRPVGHRTQTLHAIEGTHGVRVG